MKTRSSFYTNGSWAVSIGLVLMVGREIPDSKEGAVVAVAAVELAAVFLATRMPRTALAVTTAAELVAAWQAWNPNPGVGGFVVCAAHFYRQPRQGDERFSNEAALTAPVFVAIAALALVPWALRWPSSSVMATPIRDAGDAVELLFILSIAVGIRANFNVFDFLFRGATERAEEAEASRDAAVADERARIARELHDVVAHQMSVVVTQAQGAEALVDRDPGRVRDALSTISRTTREALVEMRRLVDVDRRPDTVAVDDPAAPMPGLAMDDLRKLFDNAEAAGLDVEAHIDLEGPIPAGIALAAHRTIQEALTNAAKHAPGSHVDVRVRQGNDILRVEVTNGPSVRGPADVPGSGVGLVGMRERVTLFGGRVNAAPQDGGFRVVATLPLVPEQ